MYKHGYTRDIGHHPLYGMWQQMRQRCSNPNNKDYKHYGARGVYCCERWNSFASFIDDMGERPPKHDLDRVDNNGPYSPENCVWTEHAQNLKNRRRWTLTKA